MGPVHCSRKHKTDKKKKLKSQPLPATVHMNSNRSPLIECAAAGKKKKKKVKKRKRKRKSWIQNQPEMFKDQVDKQWKYTYLIVEIRSPTPSQLILESYMPAYNMDKK